MSGRCRLVKFLLFFLLLCSCMTSVSGKEKDLILQLDYMLTTSHHIFEHLLALYNVLVI